MVNMQIRFNPGCCCAHFGVEGGNWWGEDTPQKNRNTVNLPRATFFQPLYTVEAYDMNHLGPQDILTTSLCFPLPRDL